MKRKATLHRKQKSQDVTSRRSALKSSKSRDERAPTTSPTTLPWDIEWPKGIRELLINSRTQIKQNKTVLKIPKEYKYQNPEVERRPNVKETLEEFANHFLRESGKSLNQPVQDESLIPVITRGLLVYFEKTLAAILLYKEERGQHAFLDNKFRSGTGATIDDDEDALIPLTSWYGADHLLRLLVQLPEILKRASLDPYSIDVINTYVQYLLDKLTTHQFDDFSMPSQFIISHRAYLSILLHTSKYPHQACNGVLLGTVKPSGETIVERSLPLLHNWTGLSPMMEIGLDMAATHAATLNLSIMGYYQASPNFHDRGLGPVGDKVLAKLRQTSPNALGLLVHLDELTSKSHSETPGLVTTSSSKVALHNQQSVARVMELISSGLPSRYADFDDHLENVQLDWLNNADCDDNNWSTS
ncbi:UPF0172-domain-containing protein [Serendipita vermifera]|nr:UPF0172-domain-containing protein [Serendipita vermifera]